MAHIGIGYENDSCPNCRPEGASQKFVTTFVTLLRSLILFCQTVFLVKNKNSQNMTTVLSKFINRNHPN